MANKHRFSQKKVLDCVKKHDGFLTYVAKELGVSYQTIWNYVQRFPKIKAALQDLKERNLDIAETKLLEKINQGSSTDIQFFLRTQGMSRGYVTRTELTGADGGKIETSIDITQNIPSSEVARLKAVEYLAALKNEEGNETA